MRCIHFEEAEPHHRHQPPPSGPMWDLGPQFQTLFIILDQAALMASRWSGQLDQAATESL